ncbi:MAG: tetratricopeptide repeat protein [Methanomassiliicoccales archaeon]
MKDIKESLEQRLVERISEAIATLDANGFREVAIELLRSMEIMVTGVAKYDESLMIEAEKKEEKYLIFISRRASDASLETLKVIREKAKLEERIPGLIVFGDFDESARKFAQDNEIAFADRSIFVALLRKYGIAERLLSEIDRRILEREGPRYLPSKEKFDAALQAAEELMKRNKFKEALSSIEEALRIKSDNFAAWQKKALALASLGKIERAIEACEKAIEMKPDEAYTWYLLGVFKGQSGDLLGEVHAYNNALKLHPQMAPALLNKGAALYQLGKLEEALVVYDAMLRIYPSHAQALNNRGLVLKAMGRTNEALKSFELALASDPRNLEALVNKASLLSSLAMINEAVDAWQEVVRVEGGRAEFWLQLGHAQKAAGLFEEAANSFNMALELNPNLEEALAERDEALAAGDMIAVFDRKKKEGVVSEFLSAAIILSSLGRYEESLAEIEKCLKIEPRVPFAHRFRAGLLLNLGRMEEALASIRESVRESPSDKYNLLDLEAIVYRLGRREDSLRILNALGRCPESNARQLLLLLETNRTNQLEPSSLEGNGGISREAMALLCMASGKYHDAIKLFEDFLAKGESTPEILNNLGVCYRLIGDLERSMESIKKAISLAPAYPDAWNNLGCLYYLTAEYTQALKCFDEALVLDTRPSFLINKGMCHLARDDLEGASTSFLSALRLEESADALNCLGIVAERKKEFVRALELYNAALEKAPKFHDARVNRDRVLGLLKEGR